MKRTNPSHAVALAALLAVTATAALADTVFTYQGRLNEDGGPASGAYDMRFRLFDAASGGSQVGPLVSASDVPVSDGLFTAELDFGMGVFDGDPRWLQVEVFAPDNQVWRVLSPRQPLTAVPYAMYAFGGPGGPGFWAGNGSHIFNTNAGNVGVGTTTPEYALDVRSDGVRAIFGQSSAASGITQGVYGEAVSRQGTGVWGISLASSGVAPGVRGETSSTEGYAVWGVASATSGSNVGGLFRSSSTEGHGVIGSVLASSGVNYGVFGQTGSPDGFAGYFVGGKNHFGGNVGIRTTDPTAILDINGEGSQDTLLRLNHPGASTGQILFTSPTGSVGMVGVANNTNRRDIRFSDLGLFLVANDSPDTPPATHGVFVGETGRVGIGTYEPGGRLHVISDETSSSAGLFQLSGGNGGAAAVIASTSGGEATAVRGSVAFQGGTGRAGWFTISNPLNTNPGIEVNHHGQGSAGVFELTRDDVPDSAIVARTEGTGMAGHFLQNGGGNAGTAILAQAFGNVGSTVWATASGQANAVYGHNNGPGKGGVFEVSNASNNSYALEALSNGTGVALLGHTTGDAVAGYFVNRSATNSRPAVYCRTDGTGLALHADGTARVEVLEITGADVAEKFPTSESAAIEPGTVMAIDPANPGKLRIAAGEYNRCVAGVVSGAGDVPVGAILGNLPGQSADAPAIALSGRVWVRCDASDAAIQPGDLLTTSATPGHAKTASDPARSHGAVIGKAMTGLEAGETGLVLVLVNLQ